VVENVRGTVVYTSPNTIGALNYVFDSLSRRSCERRLP